MFPSGTRVTGNFVRSLLLFADPGAKNGFNRDECNAMECVLGSTAKKCHGKLIEGRSMRRGY